MPCLLCCGDVRRETASGRRRHGEIAFELAHIAGRVAPGRPLRHLTETEACIERLRRDHTVESFQHHALVPRGPRAGQRRTAHTSPERGPTVRLSPPPPQTGSAAWRVRERRSVEDTVEAGVFIKKKHLNIT